MVESSGLSNACSQSRGRWSVSWTAVSLPSNVEINNVALKIVIFRFLVKCSSINHYINEFRDLVLNSN